MAIYRCKTCSISSDQELAPKSSKPFIIFKYCFLILITKIMKKLIFLLFTFHFSLLTINAQWLQQISGVTTPLYNIEFVNRYTGWVTGNSSVILKTTNGGVNWFSQSIDLGYPKNLYGLDMLDANTGYIAGWFETILKTTNGGINWLIISNIPSNDGNSNNGISFLNSTTGWICSFGGRVLRTSNGGINWDTAYTGTGGPLRDIQFLNAQIGWACGEGGVLVKSTNGGANWIAVPNLSGANIQSLHFININTGWAVTEQSNFVYRTTNSGIKWDTISILPGGSSQYSYTIYFTSALTGYVGGTYSRLFKTTNGGLNWARDVADFGAFIWNFDFYNDSIGWCVGGGGRILHTTTGGGPFVGIEPISNLMPDNLMLYQNYPNPFNSETVIEFDVPEYGNYSLAVYDILGRWVDEIFNKYLTPGKYRTSYNGINLSSGIYFYKITGMMKTIAKKFILIK